MASVTGKVFFDTETINDMLIKQPLVHLPLERYRQRYTEHLVDWEKEAFSKQFAVEQIFPVEESVPYDIRTGEVLDAARRPVYAMGQIAQIIKSKHLPHLGKVYFSDFYTPGLDALAYSRKEFYGAAFLWAQTFDRYDFTTNFIHWMRPWEVMAFELYQHVFVASTLLKELIVTALPNVEERVHVVGLPFNSKHVAAQWDESKVPGEEFAVVYTSRWDLEKQPSLFLDLVMSRPDLKFAVCTGHDQLRGSDQRSVQRALRMAQTENNFTIFAGLSKPEYYSILTRCHVQFNCALQDWVSFTLLEALTHHCWPLYPNHRSFPEALNYDERFLYMPNNLEDANRKLNDLLEMRRGNELQYVLDHHDQALDNIVKILS